MKSNDLVTDTLKDLQECVAQLPYLLTLLAGAIEAERRKPFFVATSEETGVTQ